MSDTALNKVIQYGTAAARAAFVPNPAATSKLLYLWYDTDAAPNTYAWNGAAWVQINPTSATTTAHFIVSTTEAGLPNSSRLVAGAGITIVGTTGTTTVSNSATTSSYVVATTSTIVLPNSVVITGGTGISVTQTAGTIVIASSGGSGWAFVTTAAASGATVDFTGLAAYNEILIIMKDVTGTGACIRQLLVSTNNGSTFMNASGDYVTFDSSGATTNGTVLSFDNGNNATSHWGYIIISCFNQTASIKPAVSGGYSTNLVGFVNTTTALNAIRARPHANAFNGGNFYVYGR